MTERVIASPEPREVIARALVRSYCDDEREFEVRWADVEVARYNAELDADRILTALAAASIALLPPKAEAPAEPAAWVDEATSTFSWGQPQPSKNKWTPLYRRPPSSTEPVAWVRGPRTNGRPYETWWRKGQPPGEGWTPLYAHPEATEPGKDGWVSFWRAFSNFLKLDKEQRAYSWHDIQNAMEHAGERAEQPGDYKAQAALDAHDEQSALQEDLESCRDSLNQEAAYGIKTGAALAEAVGLLEEAKRWLPRPSKSVETSALHGAWERIENFLAKHRTAK